MRIDGPAPAPVARLAGSTPPSGARLFEDLLSAPVNDAAGDARPRPDQRLFGFDTLGVLGMGGTSPKSVAECGMTATAAPPGVKPDDKPQHASAKATAPPPIAMFAEAASSAAATAPAGQSEAPPPIQATALNPAAPVSAVQGAAEATRKIAPVIETMPVLAPATIMVRGPSIRHGPSSAFAKLPDLDTVRTPAAPRVRLDEMTREPPAGQVSLAVAEKDGALHIAAAAPGITEDARLRLRKLAEDIARESGDVVGDFILNGHSLTEPSSSARSLP